MGRHKKDDGYPYFRLVPTDPPPHMSFIRRRIGGLATFEHSNKPLIDLLANAYILGMEDAIGGLDRLDDKKCLESIIKGEI